MQTGFIFNGLHFAVIITVLLLVGLFLQYWIRRKTCKTCQFFQGVTCNNGSNAKMHGSTLFVEADFGCNRHQTRQPDLTPEQLVELQLFYDPTATI